MRQARMPLLIAVSLAGAQEVPACDVCSQAIVAYAVPWLPWGVALGVAWNAACFIIGRRSGAWPSFSSANQWLIFLLIALSFGSFFLTSLSLYLLGVLLIAPVLLHRKAKAAADLLEPRWRRRISLMSCGFIAAIALCILLWTFVLPRASRADVIVDYETSGFTDSLLRSLIRARPLAANELAEIYRRSRSSNLVKIERIAGELPLTKDERVAKLLDAYEAEWNPGESYIAKYYETALRGILEADLPENSPPEAWRAAAAQAQNAGGGQEGETQ